MSSEQNVPEVEVAPGFATVRADRAGRDRTVRAGRRTNVPHGMGQSKSSRRRRRKRKNKVADAAQGAQPGWRPVRGQTSRQAARLRRHRKPPQSFQANGGGAATGRPGRPASAGRRSSAIASGSAPRRTPATRPAPAAVERQWRWLSRPDTHQPGNSVGGFKRKGGAGSESAARAALSGRWTTAIARSTATSPIRRPRRSRSHGNYQGRRRRRTRLRERLAAHRLLAWARPIPIPEDAPTKIFFFIEDLFFNAKIHGDRAQAGRQGRLHQEREGSDRGADRAARKQTVPG